MKKQEVKYNIPEEYLREYYENEYDANKQISYALALTGGIIGIIWILYLIPGIFTITKSTRIITGITLPIVILILDSPLFWIKRNMGHKPAFKYFVLITFMLSIAVLNVIIPKHAIIGWALAIVIVNHYYNPKLGRTIFIITLVAMLISIYLAMFFGEYDPNLLMGELDDKASVIHQYIDYTVTFPDTPQGRYEYLKYLLDNDVNRFVSVFIYYYASRAVILLILFYISNRLNKRTNNLLIKELAVNNKQINQSKELEIASKIQLSALPESFRATKDIEIIANLKAAKEVGGDFYDYYKIDDNHIAIVIGDVSGKGTPAAMLMMKTITCFKNFIKMTSDPKEVLALMNDCIFDGNDNEMFVTCFLGVLDIEKGILTYSSAGHNPPIIQRKNKAFYLNLTPSFVLGGISGMKYLDNEFNLEKGDSITLYTDGITEARNKDGEFYGEDRLLALYSKRQYDSIINLHYELDDDLKKFTDGFDQFDDMTYLTLKYKGGIVSYQEIILDAKVENVSKVNDLINEVLSKNKLSEYKNTFSIVVDEIFSNIAKYAYNGNSGEVYVRTFYTKDSNELTVTFIDKGVEFNQLEKESKLVDENYESREVGGLGTHIVKSFIDSYSYSRINGKNILVVRKKL